MPLSDFLIAGSIILGLVSIPILVTGPFSDTIPTGRLVLNMSDVDVEGVPTKISKIFSSDQYQKTYETAFGRFNVSISAGKIQEELSKPGKVTIVSQDTQETVWKINTQQYQLEVTKTPDSVTQICTTPDGELKKIKQKGQVTESFQGMNQDYVIEVCAQAEEDLQEEVNKIEQIVSESEIPLTENKGNSTATKVKIVQINVDAESVRLENRGSSDLNMNNWGLNNNKEVGTGTYTYKFSNFTLNASSYVYVYSDDEGNSTVCNINATSLCWNKNSIWSPTSDIAILKDSNGNEIDRCIYIKSDIKNSLVNCE